ncbi:hypothetical protein V6N13_046625 [Hibiscus sabdariffa]
MKNDEQGIHGMFDITFTRDTKVLRIPTLQVNHQTVRKLLNYVIYEQLFTTEEPTYFVDYVLFMYSLINTSEDVQLLCESGIIHNGIWIMNDLEIPRMFRIFFENRLKSHDTRTTLRYSIVWTSTVRPDGTNGRQHSRNNMATLLCRS